MIFGDIAGIVNAFNGEPDYMTVRKVKNQGIEDANQSLLGDFRDSRTRGQEFLRRQENEWNAARPVREAQTGQEVANIDRYYDGSIERLLSGLRAGRQRAVQGATDLGIDRGFRAMGSNSIVGGGGPSSSYGARLRSGLSRDAMIAAALDAANQERSDFGWTEGQRLGLTGRRSQLQDDLLRRNLIPKMLQDAEEARLLGNLGGITGIDQANTFYGLQQEVTDADKWQKAADALDSLIMTAASLYATGGASAALGGGGAGGGGGGGGIASMFGGGGGGSPSLGQQADAWGARWSQGGGSGIPAGWAGGRL